MALNRFLLVAAFAALASSAVAQPTPPPSPWVVSGSSIYYNGCVRVPSSAACMGNGTINTGAAYAAGNPLLSATLVPPQYQLVIGSGTSIVAGLGSVGSSTVVLHGNASGAPTFGAVDLTTDVSGILPAANGGASNAFFAVSGPTTSLKTFAFPNVNATVLTDNATVTAAQGGTGIASYAIGDVLYASGATTLSKLADVATGSVLTSGGVTTAPAWSAAPRLGTSLEIGSQQTTQGSLILDNTAAGAFATTIKSSNSASAAWTLTLPTTAGTNTYVLTTNGSGVTSWAASSSSAVPTYTVLTSGTGATYTTPANARQLRVWITGGAAGGNGSSTSGGDGGLRGAGGNSSFDNGGSPIVANGGGASGSRYVQGAGGTGGTGTADRTIPGGDGGEGQTAGGVASPVVGGAGGSSCAGFGAHYGNTPAANSGGGGPGADAGAATAAEGGGGGGGGECRFKIYNSPAASYTYTIGAGGTAGAAGTGGVAGRAGATGVITIEVLY